LGELRVPLRPEGGAPRGVEIRDVAVLGAQPFAERRSGYVAVATAHVTAVLVVDVPHLERRMVRIAFCQLGDEAPRELPIDRRARAVVLASARREHGAVEG